MRNSILTAGLVFAISCFALAYTWAVSSMGCHSGQNSVRIGHSMQLGGCTEPGHR